VRTPQDAAGHFAARPKAAAEQRSRRNPEAHTVRPEDEGSELCFRSRISLRRKGAPSKIF
jgi:hypothetical protein